MGHARGKGKPGDFFRQGNMGFVEGSLRAMQNCHQVDDCIVSRQSRCQVALVVHIELQDRQPGQMQQMAGIGSAPRGNGHEPALAHQFFTELRTDKAAATQNHNFFMALILHAAATQPGAVANIAGAARGEGFKPPRVRARA